MTNDRIINLAALRQSQFFDFPHLQPEPAPRPKDERWSDHSHTHRICGKIEDCFDDACTLPDVVDDDMCQECEEE